MNKLVVSADALHKVLSYLEELGQAALIRHGAALGTSLATLKGEFMEWDAVAKVALEANVALTDADWERMGYDISVQPFRHPDLNQVVYKNYIRDGSGRYRGYLWEKPVLFQVGSKSELTTALMALGSDFKLKE